MRVFRAPDWPFTGKKLAALEMHYIIFIQTSMKIFSSFKQDVFPAEILARVVTTLLYSMNFIRF